jgi:hypothetical protein
MRLVIPDHRHRVGLEDLVDPRLAADAAVGAPSPVSSRAISCAASVEIGREHVLDLVEQQPTVLAALQEHLADLQRAVAVAGRQRVAVAVGVLDLVQLEPGACAATLRELGLAVPGGPYSSTLTPGLLALHAWRKHRGQHLLVVADIAEVGRRQLAARGRAA